jgi:hypothetical protein
MLTFLFSSSSFPRFALLQGRCHFLLPRVCWLLPFIVRCGKYVADSMKLVAAPEFSCFFGGRGEDCRGCEFYAVILDLYQFVVSGR